MKGMQFLICMMEILDSGEFRWGADITFVVVWQAVQSLHKRGRVWYHTYMRVILLQPGMRPNQITPRHHQYCGAIPNSRANQ